MAIDSAELGINESEVGLKPRVKRERPFHEKAAIAAGKVALKGARGVTKALWKTKLPVAVTGIALGGGLAGGDLYAGNGHVKDAFNKAGHTLSDLKSRKESSTENATIQAAPLSNFDLVFPSPDPKLKEDSYTAVLKTQDEIREAYTDEIVRHVFQEYEAPLKQQCIENNVPFEVVMGILLWESKGDPNALSKDGAVGLFQWIKAVADDEDLEVNDTVDKRKDPDAMIPAEVKKFAKDMFNTGSVDAAVEVQHMGLKNYMDLARGYLERKYGLKFDDILVKPTEDTDEAIAVASAQADYNLRIIRLNLLEHKVTAREVLIDSVNQKILSSSAWDSADAFARDTVSAYNVYAQRKIELDLGE